MRNEMELDERSEEMNRNSEPLRRHIIIIEMTIEMIVVSFFYRIRTLVRLVL